MTTGANDDSGKPFERRVSDGIDETRITELALLPEHEWRLTILRLFVGLQEQVDGNTDITADTQEVLHRDVKEKVAEMYALFDAAKSGLAFLGRVGDRIGKIAAWIDRRWQRIAWVGALCVALGTYVKTGKMPDWWWAMFPK